MEFKSIKQPSKGMAPPIDGHIEKAVPRISAIRITFEYFFIASSYGYVQTKLGMPALVERAFKITFAVA